MAAPGKKQQQRRSNGPSPEQIREYNRSVDPALSQVKLAEDVSRQTAAKVGLFGRQGAGKTVLAHAMAIATLQLFCKGCDAIASYDSEGGSDFLLPMYKTEGIRRLIVRSRSLADLVAMARQAEADKKVGALVVDQITHPWNGLMEALRAKLGIKKLAFHHFNEIKNNWRPWPEFYVNSRLHIFVCGRLGYEWVDEVDEETGEKESVKGGTKMKTEVDFGHEPNMLLELEQREVDGRNVHRVRVDKDRAWTLNGKFFDFPDRDHYEKGYAKEILQSFMPHYRALNIGGAQQAFDETRSDQHLFNKRGDSAFTKAKQDKDIALEAVQNTMTLFWPGQEAAVKAIKVVVIEELFGTRSWQQIERDASLMKCQKAVRILKAFEKRMVETKTDTKNKDHVMSAFAEAKRIEEEEGHDGLGITNDDAPPTESGGLFEEESQ